MQVFHRTNNNLKIKTISYLKLLYKYVSDFNCPVKEKKPRNIYILHLKNSRKQYYQYVTFVSKAITISLIN